MGHFRRPEWVYVRINAEVFWSFESVLKMHLWNTKVKQNKKVNTFKNSKTFLPLMTQQLRGLFSSSSTVGLLKTTQPSNLNKKNKDGGVAGCRRFSSQQQWSEFGTVVAQMAVSPSIFIDSLAIMECCFVCKQARFCLCIPLELKTKHLLAFPFVLWQPSS